MVISMVACGTESAESLDELIALGAQYLLDGNYEEAVVAFDKAINVDGKCIIAYVGKADANLGLENYPEAESVFSKIIEIDEAYIPGYIGLADTYMFMDNEDGAFETLQIGFDKTGNLVLSQIIDEVTEGTYEPNKLHEDWESIYAEYAGIDFKQKVGNADKEPTDESDSWRDSAAKVIQYYGYDGNEYSDESGEMLAYKHEYYDEGGNLIKIEYNDAQFDRVASEEETRFVGDGTRSISYYDANGNVSRMEWYWDEAFQYYILFEYDANGNVTKETSYNADGTLDMSWLE